MAVASTITYDLCSCHCLVSPSLIGTTLNRAYEFNRHLQPHMLNLALNITGMTNDDLFYYKNKVRIDNVALSYQEQARALAAPT